MTEPTCRHCGTDVVASGKVDATTGLVLAKYGVRVAATIIDFLILAIPELILRSGRGDAVGTCIFIVVFGVYLVTQWSRCDGRSVGNRVAKSRIVDAATGASISTKQAFNRFLYLELYAIVNLFGAVEGSGAIVLLAFIYGMVDNLYPLFDQRNQTLHDKFVGTIVVMTA